PEPIEPSVRHLEHAADVARLLLVEEDLRRLHVRVSTVPTLEHPERHERIEEVPRRPRVERELTAEALEVQRAARERREDPELDGAQQRLRAPESEAKLKDFFRRHVLAHFLSPCSARALVRRSR